MVDIDILRYFAAKYIWWKTPDEALLHPNRVIAQVMDLGTFEDMQTLIRQSDDKLLVGILEHAEAGWFSPRSWHFWHYKLGLAKLGNVPALPVKKFE